MSTIEFSTWVKLKLINIYQEFIKMFYSQRNEDNVTSVVYRLMKKGRIKVTFNTVAEYIKSHPNFPSLKCICDFFNEMNIVNYALRIDEQDLYKLDDQFIAHIKESGGKVIMVYSVDKKRVVFADSLKGKRAMNTRKFLDNWDGVVIIIEPTELSGESDYNEKRKNEIINKALLPLAILVFCLLIFFGVARDYSVSEIFSDTTLFALLLAHLTGLTFSVLLLRQELNLKTKFTDKLCHLATNADCDAVTKSKASKIFGSITWADAGIVYFTGGLTALFILPIVFSFNTLSVLAISALPYPVFSVLYQWIKIRKWCPLCFSVQFVIILESVIAFNILNFNELRISYFMPVLILFSIVFLFVLLFKFLFIISREMEHLKLETLKMKRDPEVFLYKLNQGERLDIAVDEHALVFGDTQSTILMSVFLSFHCSACSKKFDHIVRLMDKNFKFKIQLIFSPPLDDISGRLFKSVYHSAKFGDKNLALKELITWYNTDSKKRLKLVPVNNIEGTIDGYTDMISYNTLLFSKGYITAVPSVYVNGYLLPDTYTMEDIRYHSFGLEKIKRELEEIEV